LAASRRRRSSAANWRRRTVGDDSTAIGRARQLVRFALSQWGLAALADDAELVASELMTNAVQATGATSTQAPPDDLGTATVQVRVLMYPASIIIEVWTATRARRSGRRRPSTTKAAGA
jgi:anti-sigma regulatory factor (Ser/Thr protein kinase)